jgi:hypothetical protein
MGKKNRKRPAATPVGSRPTATSVEPPRPAARPASKGPLPAASAGAMGAYIGIAIGVGFLVLAALGGLRADPLPTPLVLALLLSGAFEVALCWQTIQRSRVAWSFAVALSGTVTLATLFGAPKIRDALGVPIMLAVLPSLIAAVATVLLAMAAEEISSRSS